MSGSDEEWRSLKSPLDKYQVSNLGMVKGSRGKNLTPDISNGYFRVGLQWKDDEGKHVKQYLVHRLIAETFIPNPDNLPQVDHINHTKIDNSVSNLRWTSELDNQNNRRKRKATIKRRPVVQYTKTGEFVREWESAGEAGKALNITNAAIVYCCTGKTKTSAGFTWKYKDLSIAGEEWKIIEVAGKSYEVSDYGRVKDSTGHVYEGNKSSGDYIRFKTQYLHKLVAIAFVKGDITLTADHKDGNKHNNKATNLEWVSQAENNRRMVKKRDEQKLAEIQP